MAELVKPWDDGGSLTVTYTGDGDGSAVFTSDANEGIDREMIVTFKGAGQEIERVVKQEGFREIFNEDFILADGGTFNVLKVVEPSWRDYYKEVEYLESTGKQYINTGVYVNPDYSIEVTFVMTQRNATWDTLFGTRNSSLARFTARWANSATGNLGIHRSRAKTGSYENYDDTNAKKNCGDRYMAHSKTR